jgi:hypothetical protein
LIASNSRTNIRISSHCGSYVSSLYSARTDCRSSLYTYSLSWRVIFGANNQHRQAACWITTQEFHHLERVMFPALIHHKWAVYRAPITTFLSWSKSYLEPISAVNLHFDRKYTNYITCSKSCFENFFLHRLSVGWVPQTNLISWSESCFEPIFSTQVVGRTTIHEFIWRKSSDRIFSSESENKGISSLVASHVWRISIQSVDTRISAVGESQVSSQYSSQMGCRHKSFLDTTFNCFSLVIESQYSNIFTWRNLFY